MRSGRWVLLCSGFSFIPAVFALGSGLQRLGGCCARAARSLAHWRKGNARFQSTAVLGATAEPAESNLSQLPSSITLVAVFSQKMGCVSRAS